MVIRSSQNPPRGQPRRGSLSIELTVAVGILVTVLMPLSLCFPRELAVMRSLYHHAVAMEIVDGEMEVLRAGEWRAFAPGAQPYPVRAGAATNLPPGRFVLTLTNGVARLEWLPDSAGRGGRVVREFSLNPGDPAVSPPMP
jgi:hypothetical protein